MSNEVQTNTIIRLKQVMALTGLSRATIYKLIKEGLFPKQVKLSQRCVGWPEHAVIEWNNSRMEA